MKVLHVSNYFRGTHSHVGGAEQACFRTARMLIENGHQTFVATKAFENPAPAKQFRPIDIQALPVIEDFLPAPVARYVEVAKWYSLQYDPLARHGFRKILEQEKPDVVHFHNFQFLTFSLVRESWKQKIPICASIYDYWHFCPKAMLLLPDNSFCREAHGIHCLDCLPDTFRPVQRALLTMRRRIFDAVFEMIDTFIVLSEHSKEVLVGYGIPDEKISIVPLTLPIEYQDTTSAASVTLPPKSILFVGWLNDRKGVHIAIEAMPNILERVPDARLYVIGGQAKFATDYEGSFRAFIRDHNLEERVVFIGHQSPETVQEYLKASTVLILPEQYENMSPLVMIEAMLLGTPVVASNLGGIPEYIEDGVNGFLADPYNPADFAGKLVPLLRDNVLSDKVGKKAQERILERNNNNRIWRDILAVYARLAAKDGEHAI